MSVKISNLSIGNLISYSVRHIPIVWVKSDDKVWVAASMLNRYLGTFIDCLPVMQEGQFVNFVDGKDLLSKVLKNPTYDLFQYALVEDIVNKSIPLQIFSSNTTLSILLEDWIKNKRAYSLLKNNNGSFSIISARTVVDALTLLDTNVIFTPVANDVITCSRDYTIGDVMQLMFMKKIRRIFFEDDFSFISDRTIIKKIVHDFEFLNTENNFLNLKAGTFESLHPIFVKDNVSIQELCKFMIREEHPCIMLNDGKVITHYDILLAMKNSLN